MTRPLAADWKAAVFAMVMTHVYDDHGVTSNEVCNTHHRVLPSNHISYTKTRSNLGGALGLLRGGAFQIQTLLAAPLPLAATEANVKTHRTGIPSSPPAATPRKIAVGPT